MVEMKVLSLKDWDPFWVSHFKRSTDKLVYVGKVGGGKLTPR